MKKGMLNKTCDEIEDCIGCYFYNNVILCDIAYKTHNTFQDIIYTLEKEIKNVKEHD